MPLISAHRCGAGADQALENTRIALEKALQLDVDYVEFDVQRCADETFVLYHDDHIVIDGRRAPLASMSFVEFAAHAEHYLRYDEVLQALKGKKKAHIDFKFMSEAARYRDPAGTHEVVAAKQAIDILGPENLIVTSLEDQSVRALRDWSAGVGIELLVGLSLGRDVNGAGLARKIRVRLSELFPFWRVRQSRANLVVANHRLAELTVGRYAAWAGLPLLVWTVDEERDLRRWLADPRVWMVTTNYPEVASRVATELTASR